MPTADDIETKMTAAATAIEAGDWATALTKALAAKALLIALPDFERGDEALRWNRDAVDKFIEMVREEQAADVDTGGIQRTNIEYERADATSDW